MTPRSLSRFEFNLVRILRFCLGQLPAEQALPLLAERRAVPPCLSADCVHLVKDSLAKGCVLFLVRAGGWRNDRYIRDGTPVPGRVWQRIPLAERSLSFSRHVLDFLIWLTAEPVNEPRSTWSKPASGLTAGDHLFFLMTHDAATADAARSVTGRVQSLLAETPLVRLAHPTAVPPVGEYATPVFTDWFSASGGAILECLQPWLAAQWLRDAWELGRESNWGTLARRGRSVGAVLDAYLAAADRAGRRDLARFVLRSAGRILTVPDHAADSWSGGLIGDGPPRLQERLDTRRAAMAVPERFAVLEGWTRSARGVSYFDEGYAASQMWKEDWEAANGDLAGQTARRVLAEVEPLRAS